MKRVLLAVVLVVALLALLAAPGVASAGPTSPPPPPPGSLLVMNATEGFVNVEDSGNVGYWALENGPASVKVWLTPDGSFYGIWMVVGRFTTFAGVPSPNCNASGSPLEKGTGTGIYHGWLAFAFTADGYTPKFGRLGVFDAGGTKDDLLLGTYDRQTGDNEAPIVAFMNHFPGWSWDNWAFTGAREVYGYRSQRMVMTLTNDAVTVDGNIVVGQ